MKHLKQILKIFVFLILVCCGVLFASCGNDGGTAVISCSNAQLDIVLGEDESKTFNINVSGGQFDMSSLVVESFEENSIIGIEVKKYSNNFATVVVSPIAPGSATIKVSGGSNSAEPQQVLVNVIMPIESISLKQEFDGKLYAIKGGSVKLYSLNFVQYSAKDVVGFERYETNQKGYSLKLANSNLENVSLQNGVLSVGENFQGDSISLIAESNYYDQYNQNENLKFTFDVKVLNQITTEVYVNTDKGLKLEDGVTVSSPITDGQAISLFPKEETQNSATIYVYAYVNNQADEVMLVKNVDETRFDLELISASGFDSGLNAYKFVYKLTSFNAGFSDFINFTASYKNYTLGNKNQEYSAQTNKLAVKTYNRPQSVVANGVAKNTNLTVYENVSSVSKGSTLTLTLTPGNLASEYNLITLFVDDIVDVNNLPFDFYTMNATKTGFTKQVWSQNKTITIPVGTKLFVVKNGNYSENNLSAIIYAQESSYFNEIGNERTKIAITVSVKPGASGIYLAGLNENSEYILLDETNLLGGSTKTIVADLNQQNEIILAISPSNFDIGLNSIAKVLNTKLASATSFEVLGADENYVYVKFNILPLAVGTTKLNIYLQDGSFAELNLKIVSKLEYFDVSINSDEATTIAKYYEKYADGENNYLKLAIQNGTNIQLNYEVNPTNAEYRLDFGFYDIENSGKTLSNENFADYIGGEFADQSAYINVTRLKNYGIVEAANSLAEGKVLVKITVFGIGEDGTEIEQSTHYVLVEVYRGVDSFNVSSSLIDVYSYDSVGSKNVMQSISEFTIRVQSNNGRPTYLENLEMFLGLNSSTKVEFNSGVARIEDENGEVLLTITKILTGNEYRFNVQAMSAKQNQFIFTFKLVEVAQNSPITALVRVNVKQAVEISYIELVNVDDEIYIDNYNNKNGSEFIVLTNVYAEDGKEPLNSKLIYELSSSLTSKGITVENGKISAPKNTSGVGTLTIYPESNYFDGTIVGEPVVTLNVVVANGENKETAIRLYTASDVANIADQQDVNKSNLHYVLVGNITLTNSISSFSGHLYGDFNNITSTLACENGAIFEELTSTAVVENLNVVGLLAKTNNGTIKNVCVLNSETISNTSEDFVGGLANINNGTIQNCQVEASISGKNVGGVAGKNAGTISNTLFAGTISASVNAGGIAAENEGTITSCKVEKWSENTGSMISATGSNSTYVGAIVGTNNSGAKIEKTYAYAYNQTSADIVAASATVGGIAGYNYGEISQCMTNFVVNDSLATKFASAGSGAITNSYILGADFAASHYQGVTDPEYYDAEIWGIEEGYNNNLPYLKSCYYPKPVSQIETEINEDSGILYSAEDNLIVLYYYDLTETLSNEIAQTQLQNKNTYAISKILSSTEGLSIKSTSSIIKVSGGNLIVRGVGKATLKLQSNYATQDCEEMEITVCVIYPVINFDVYSGTAINGGNVVKNSALIRRATDSILSTAVSNKIILNNTAYEFTSNLYAVLFNAKNAADYDANSAILGISTNYSIEDKKEKPLSIGTFIIKPYEIKPDENGKEFDNFTLTATLALQNENLNNFYPDFTAGDISKINLLIGEKFNKTIQINTYRGATSIKTTITEGELSPSNILSFDVEVESDNTSETLTVEILDSNGQVVDLFNKTSTLADGSDNVWNGTVSVSVKDDERINITEQKEYVVKLSTSNNAIVKTVKLIVIPQKVLNISYNHYSQQSGSEDSIGVSSISTSVLKPDTNGILAINLFPNFAAYEKIEISGIGDDGSYVLLQQMIKVGESFKNAPLGYSSERNNELLTIYPTQSLRNDGGMIYVRTKLLANVNDGVNFPILVRVYQKDGTVLDATCVIVSETVNKAEISFKDGSKEAVIVRGGTLEFNVIVNEDEELGNIELSDYNTSVTTQLKDGDTLNYYYNRNNYEIINGKKVYKITLSAGVNAEIDDDGYVRIQTEMIRIINKKEERAYDYANVRIVDFVVEKIEISGAARDVNVFESYVGLDRTLKFNITLSKVPTTAEISGDIKNGVDRIKAAQEHFLTNFTLDGFTFKNESYEQYQINMGKGNNILLNLYDANSNPVYVDGKVVNNEYFTFKDENVSATSVTVLGSKVGTTKMLLKFDYLLPETTNALTYSYEFSIKTIIYQDEDTPIQINTTEEFLQYMNAQSTQSGEKESYILMNDIYLENFTPIASTDLIASLDGNNKVITIKNFNTSNADQTLNLALFNTVSDGTTLKNLTVNLFELEDIIVDESVTTDVNVAGLFINNEGIIYNCEVVCLDLNSNGTTPTYVDGNGIRVYFNKNAKAQPKQDGTSVVIAGFGINNQAEGKITNSRVGSESFKRVVDQETSINITSKHFNIVGQGEMAGFVANNKGLISASAFTNAKISNFASSDAATAGFVLNNEINAKILSSYARGYQSAEEVGLYSYSNGGISANGISAGFVYKNYAEISDCYAKINLTETGMTSSRLVSGFVYQNNNGGVISRCYAASNINSSENDLTTRKMPFSGVDQWDNSTQNGEFNNCYYIVIDYDTESILEEQYSSGAYAMSAAQLAQDDFYGFNFNLNSDYDGVWRFENGSPELISANHVAISVRYLVENYNGVVGARIFPYVEGYEYGSIINPIIIKSADEFNRAFGKTNNANINDSTAIKQNYDSSSSNAFGNYRLVADIDFDETTNVGSVKITSANMALTTKNDAEVSGIFDGNGFILKNVDISSNQNDQSLGLFSAITDGAIFKNVNITVRQVGNTDKSQVGVVCGKLLNSAIINVNVAPVDSTGDNRSEVVGANIVGGVVGLVQGASRLSNLTSSISVTSSYSTSKNYSNSSLDFKELGYSGGIAGIVDISYNSLSSAQVNKLYVHGKDVVVSGYNVGGIFGYMGSGTTAEDILFEVSGAIGDFNQQLVTTGNVLGGIVGINYGSISEARMEHEKDVQLQIENSLGGYYSSTASKIGHTGLFVKSDKSNVEVDYAGGLIGKMMAGDLENCYSKVDIVLPEAKFAGGIIGYNESNGQFLQIYAFNDVDAKDVGGIIGKNNGNPTFIRTVAMNFYSKTNSKISEALQLVAKIEEKINGNSYQNLTELKELLNAVTENSNSLNAQDVLDGDSNLIALKLSSQEGVNETLEVKIDVNNNLVYTIKHLGSFVGEITSGAINIDSSDFANNILNVNGTTLNLNKNGLKYYINDRQEQEDLKDLYISLHDFVSTEKDATKVQRMFLGAIDAWDVDMWAVNDDEYLPHLIFGLSSKVLYIETPADFARLYKYTKTGCIVIIGDNPATTFNPYEYGGSGASSGFSASQLQGLTGSATGLIFDFSQFQTQYETPINDFKGIIYGEYSGRTYLLRNISKENKTLTLFKNIIGGTVKNITFGSNDSENKQNVDRPLLVDRISNALLENVNVKNVSATLTVTNTTDNVGVLANVMTLNEFNRCTFENVELTVSGNGNLNGMLNVGLVAGNIEILTGSVNAKLNEFSFENCSITNNAVAETLNTGLIAGELLLNSSCEIDKTVARECEIQIESTSSCVQTGMLFGTTTGDPISFNNVKLNQQENKNTIALIAESGVSETYVGGYVGHAQTPVNLIYKETGNLIQGLKIDYSQLKVGKIYAGLMFGACSNGINSTNVRTAIDGTITNGILNEEEYTVDDSTALVSRIGGVVGNISGNNANIQNIITTGNINVKIVSEDTFTSAVGGVVGNVEPLITMSGITTKNDITVDNSGSNAVAVGGVIGRADKAIVVAENIRVGLTSEEKDDNPQITITATNGDLHVGGVLGYGSLCEYNNNLHQNQNSISASIYSNIDVKSSNRVNVGGVVGFVEFKIEDTDDRPGLASSRNNVTGEITVSGPEENSSCLDANVGGVAGFINNNTNSHFTSNYSNIVGNIDVTATTARVGGVVGKITSQFNGGATVSGTIDVKNSTTAYVGGVVGNATDKLTSSNNTISVGISVNDATTAYVGGIVGVAENNTSSAISSSAVSSNVTITSDGANNAEYYIGGVAGSFSGNIGENNKSNSFTGSISTEIGQANKLYVGGIAGNATVKITNALVSGNISINKNDNSLTITDLNIGGVVGKTTAEVSSTYSWGNITVADGASITKLYIGGVVGYGTGSVLKNYTLTSIYNENLGSDNQNKNVRAVVGNSLSSTSLNATNKNYYSTFVNLAIDEDGFAGNKPYNDMLNGFTAESITINFISKANTLLSTPIDRTNPDGTKLNPLTSLPNSDATLTKITYYSISSAQSRTNYTVPANAHIVGNNNTWSESSTPISTNNGYVAGFNFNITANLTDLSGSTKKYGITETNNGIIFGCSVLVKGNNGNDYSDGKHWNSINAGIANENKGLISDVSVMLYVKEAVAGAVVNNSGAITNTIVNGVVQNGATYGFNGNNKNHGTERDVGNGKIFNNFTSIRTKTDESIFNGNCAAGSLFYDPQGTEKAQTGFSQIDFESGNIFNGLADKLNANGVSTRFKQDGYRNTAAFKNNFGYVYLKNVSKSAVSTYSDSTGYQVPNVRVLEAMWALYETTGQAPDQTPVWFANGKTIQLVTDINHKYRDNNSSKDIIDATVSHTALVVSDITFEGNKYKIENIQNINAVSIALGDENKNSAGYFALLKAPASPIKRNYINNIEFNYAADKTVSASNGYAGGVAGYAENTNFSGVRSSGATITGSTVGGLIGYAVSSIYGVGIKDSHNFNTVGDSSSTIAGGIVGRAVNFIIGDYYNQITTISNYGDVTAKQDAGGIVGLNHYGSVYLALNSGTISVNSTSDFTYLNAGGIIGENDNDNYEIENYGRSISPINGYEWYQGNITKCANLGSVNLIGGAAGDSWGDCGGILGSDWNGASIKYCVNSGSLYIQTTGDRKGFCGGIAGKAYNLIENCSMTGTISIYQSETFGWLVGDNDDVTLNNNYIEPSTVKVRGRGTFGDNDKNKKIVTNVQIYADYQAGFIALQGEYLNGESYFGMTIESREKNNRRYNVQFILPLTGDLDVYSSSGNIVNFKKNESITAFVGTFNTILYDDNRMDADGWIYNYNGNPGFVQITAGAYQVDNGAAKMYFDYYLSYGQFKRSYQNGKLINNGNITTDGHYSASGSNHDGGDGFFYEQNPKNIGSNQASSYNNSGKTLIISPQSITPKSPMTNVNGDIIRENYIVKYTYYSYDYYAFPEFQTCYKNWSAASSYSETTLDSIKLTWNSKAVNVDTLTKNENGEYEISSANELAWISANIGSTYDSNIVLTDDIDLTGRVWTPIGSGESIKLESTYDNNGRRRIAGPLYVQKLDKTFYAIGQSQVYVNVYSGEHSSISSGLLSEKMLSSTVYSGTEFTYKYTDDNGIIWNIDLSMGVDNKSIWTFKTGECFSGAFDGQGHTITGMMAYDKENAGLFGSIKAKDDVEFVGAELNTWNVIQNFTLKDSRVASQGNAGAVAGKALENVDNDNAFIIRAITLDNVMGIDKTSHKEFVKNLETDKILITENAVIGSSTGIQSKTDGTELIKIVSKGGSAPTGNYSLYAYGQNNSSLFNQNTAPANYNYAYYASTTLYVNFTGDWKDDGINKKQVVTINEQPNLSVPKTFEGYTFNGWDTTKESLRETNLNTKIFNNNGILQKDVYYKYQTLKILFWGGEIRTVSVIDSNYNWVYGNSIKLYPLLDIEEYNITFNSNGGSSVVSGKYLYDSELPTPTREGYTFVGWLWTNNYSGTGYASETGTYLICPDVGNNNNASVTLVAQWEANEYKVTLDFAGGDVLVENPDYVAGGEEPEQISLEDIANINYVTATYDSEMPTLTAIPERDGFNFGGYFSGENGTGTKYYNADGTSARTWDIAGNRTLYAFWYKNTITFDSNGGTDCEDVCNVEGAAITLPAPTRTGYTFAGWYDAETNNNGSGNRRTWSTMPDLSDTTTYPTATGNTITLYAKWTPNEAHLYRSWVETLGLTKSQIRSITFTTGEIDYNDTPIGTETNDGNSVWENTSLYARKQAHGSLYDVTIYSPTTIYAPATSISLFGSGSVAANKFTYLESVTFNNFDTSKVTSMSSMFYGCSKLESLDLSGFDTSSVIYMGTMFYSCSKLTSLDLSQFNTSNVTSMSSMFSGCSSLTSLNISDFNISSSCSTAYMFNNCNSLTSINAPASCNQTIELPCEQGTSENSLLLDDRFNNSGTKYTALSSSTNGKLLTRSYYVTKGYNLLSGATMKYQILDDSTGKQHPENGHTGSRVHVDCVSGYGTVITDSDSDWTRCVVYNAYSDSQILFYSYSNDGKYPVPQKDAYYAALQIFKANSGETGSMNMNIFNSSKKYRIKLKMKTDVSGGLDVAFGLVGAQGSNVFKLTSSYQTYYIDVQNIDTSKSNNIWLDVRQAFNANQNLIYVYGIEIYEIS